MKPNKSSFKIISFVGTRHKSTLLYVSLFLLRRVDHEILQHNVLDRVLVVQFSTLYLSQFLSLSPSELKIASSFNFLFPKSLNPDGVNVDLSCILNSVFTILRSRKIVISERATSICVHNFGSRVLNALMFHP